MPLTPDAKRVLKDTIRDLRLHLCGPVEAESDDHGAIHDEARRRYRLSESSTTAALDEAHSRRRERIEAWIDERARATRAKNKAELNATKDRLLRHAEKEAAATLINRLVLLRQLEAHGLSKPAVVTGGWNSKGYREFREFSPGLTGDDSEGYTTLLQLIFDELAGDLPGLFGDVGLSRLFPIPTAALRTVVERLDRPELSSAWTDDTTLGWVYQYWNDPDREALDKKLDAKKKIEPHEIASKTQMFTERYMVEWLLQNSLGLTWLAMCKKHGWRPDADRVLRALEERRAEWRRKREAGEVALDALMPIEGELEEHWKYYVPQPITDDAVEKAPKFVRALKVLDPACGSGHFLVIAFDLLVALYREEARHLGETVTDKEIAESILENNLHGIDIDPRAIQIAAAGLYLKSKTIAKSVRPKRVNLVAPVLQLGNLPPDDPAVVVLRRDLKNEVGIPEELTNKLLSALAGVDHLGSLLKVDAAVEDAIKSVELEFERTHGQGDLFGGFPSQQVKLTVGEARAGILDKLEQFLAKRSKSEDLGLRLDGEQIAAGVRFVRIVRPSAYHVVVGNPPYADTSLLASPGQVRSAFPAGKANLYAAFLERCPAFLRPAGLLGLVTMRGWLFLREFIQLRMLLLRSHDLVCLGDLDVGAFAEIGGAVVTTAMAILQARTAEQDVARTGIALDLTGRDEESAGRTPQLKEASALSAARSHVFAPARLRSIKGTPLIYWWSERFLEEYLAAPKLESVAPVKVGLQTSDNGRYVRFVWELANEALCSSQSESETKRWAPYIKGGEGRCWVEPVTFAVNWWLRGSEVKLASLHRHGSIGKRVANEGVYFRRGVAFPLLAEDFAARVHRVPSIIDVMGASVYPAEIASMLCCMNSKRSRSILESLNPTIHFQVGDVERLAVSDVSEAEEILETLEAAFSEHEKARETSTEFERPGQSAWRYAQEWAQKAVDREPGVMLPAYEPVYESAPAESLLSFAVGVVLGRFTDEGGAPAVPNGILFLAPEGDDSLAAVAASSLHAAWTRYSAACGGSGDLRGYLRKQFFERHKTLYVNRPIYWPVSSAKKNFVAFISIHRWADDTLSVLLADYLMPTKRRLEGELSDLRLARSSESHRARAERRIGEVQKLLDELTEFIVRVTEVAEAGPPPPDSKTRKRERDARYQMDLDDGVVVNSGGLWSLVEPYWPEPKKWWSQLANEKGPKGTHFDWSKTAARYFPDRVRKKCHEDPSLAMAHKCFWELHPAKAYAWELRLQDEIRPDFTIDEPGSDEARAKFSREHEREAADILAKELRRREKKAAKADDEGEAGPLFEQGDDAEGAESDD